MAVTQGLRALQLLRASLIAWQPTILAATQATSLEVTLDAQGERLEVVVRWPAVGARPAGDYSRTWDGADAARDTRRGCDKARDVIGAVLGARGINSSAPPRPAPPARG